MVIYEVNLDVERAIEAAYRAWLTQHLPEVLACDGFIDAEVFEREGDAAQQDKLLLTVHYKIRDRQALDIYFQQHAQRLRQDGLARFGSRFSATRRILQHLQHVPPNS